MQPYISLFAKMFQKKQGSKKGANLKRSNAKIWKNGRPLLQLALLDQSSRPPQGQQ
ncbi:hypothetical protein CLU79DRAFT_838374 [Phycomyces nitens]|nr:hypothetical protein CLU79DRAFT_838372 [Phycomyces nitens]KAI9014522.1 hypothetical protein CLU79DRAFT_838374 [Phycomyces nitens]